MRWLFALVFALAAQISKADIGFISSDSSIFPDVKYEEAKLGQLLFYDPILSGNQTVSCASCHHPKFGTADGLTLGLGDGAAGLGPRRAASRDNTPEQRIPRNAPALFNLGAPEFRRMFHDGRLEADTAHASGMRTPLADDMVTGFRTPLAAQAMFPVLSGDEMAGHYSENDVAEAVRLGRITGVDGAWGIIAARVADVPEYRARFDDILGEGTPIRFTDIANMMGAFISFEWRADDSLFDRLLRDGTALPAAATRGMTLFYGKADCGSCHSGQFQTDHDFHAIAMPQLGPGKAARFENHQRDTGRLRVTGDLADAYRFRTPSLRNVVLTAPYGHAGSYAKLEGVVRHHLSPVAALYGYDRTQVFLPALSGTNDWTIMDTEAELAAIAAANELAPQQLSDGEVSDILSFLAALTDFGDGDKNGRLGVPDHVPSGFPVER